MKRITYGLAATAVALTLALTGCEPIESTGASGTNPAPPVVQDDSTTGSETPAPAASKTPKPKPAMTKSQEQAVGAAKDYLDFESFSRLGLIQQLSSKYGDGFSKKDATFAVDYLKIDFNKQAVAAAKSYLDFEHFSCNGLIQQLESKYGDQYTHAQAVYGAKKAGIC